MRKYWLLLLPGLIAISGCEKETLAPYEGLPPFNRQDSIPHEPVVPPGATDPV